MKVQNYKNHVRWYAPHHFVFYPLLSVLLIICIFYSIKGESNNALWLMCGIIIVLLVYLSLMLRQHYALVNQNRIVRLELRFRYYVLTNKRFELVEIQLAASQIYALRFAADEELPALVDRAIKEKLSGDEIKQNIKNWLPDHMRV